MACHSSTSGGCSSVSNTSAFIPAGHIRTGPTNHHIGLEEKDDGIWSISYNTVLLAKLDERDYIIRG